MLRLALRRSRSVLASGRSGLASSLARSSNVMRAFSSGSSAPKTKDEGTTKSPAEATPFTETVRDFLKPADFYNLLRQNGFDFFSGVPDSLLKDFCAYVSDNADRSSHVITANEGAAIGLAAGYHLATRKFPVVYMQNSGFGNTVNPLLSLTDPKVYAIPMLLLIGWRGEPGKKDEPQHLVQGKVMTSLLASMNIPFEVLPDFIEGATETIDTARSYLEKRSGPFALLVKRQTFTPYKMTTVLPNSFELTREAALRVMVDQTGPWDVLVATTGFAARELYEYREELKMDHRREFLTVGSMGHASAIALGIAVGKPSRQVICLDGDGAMLMHMGTMATIGAHAPENFKHVVINNCAHDSVGGQPTDTAGMDLPNLALACGYKAAFSAVSAQEIKEGFIKMRSTPGPVLLEVKVNKGARKNLGRPTTTPLQNKIQFMSFLEN
eukprot:TRINITY_DN1984_c0_g1_i1.p1 TRINITY_DN1984_c0_g1~~TRINITY_DN1984_c0_g1_i1.p1  ORF type:complete len:440 (+),score=174.68 TRINITY_DN1984_c0_g1_i1:86-1405(+)